MEAPVAKRARTAVQALRIQSGVVLLRAFVDAEMQRCIAVSSELLVCVVVCLEVTSARNTD